MPELGQLRLQIGCELPTLYQRLARITGSPVVEVNALKGYHLLASVRGDLLDKLGRRDEARTEFARAATMTQNERERALLLGRASGRSVGPPAP
jgi:predicted RNA polymerase sigma factor